MMSSISFKEAIEEGSGKKKKKKKKKKVAKEGSGKWMGALI